MRGARVERERESSETHALLSCVLWIRRPGRPIGLVVSVGCGKQRRVSRASGGQGAASARAHPLGRVARRFGLRRKPATKARPRLARIFRRDSFDVGFLERLFRAFGLTWEHEQRIRRKARLLLGPRYVRLEPRFEEHVSLAETNASSIERMEADVQLWLCEPAQVALLEDVADRLTGGSAKLRRATGTATALIAGAQQGVFAALKGFTGSARAAGDGLGDLTAPLLRALTVPDDDDPQRRRLPLQGRLANIAADFDALATSLDDALRDGKFTSPNARDQLATVAPGDSTPESADTPAAPSTTTTRGHFAKNASTWARLANASKWPRKK